MIRDLFNLFFPKHCIGCEKILLPHEGLLCLSCRHQLPLTNFHLNNENTVKKVFSDNFKVINATSLFYYYKRGITQKMLHQLKYKGKEAVSAYLGEWLSEELKASSWIDEIDAVIPVPLHKKRLRERGYNQVEGFGKTIAEKFNIEYHSDVLIKSSATKTQVFKNKLARAAIKKHHFKLQNAHKIEGKHILLVDDIITTGATLKTCSAILLQAHDVKISIATMAFTV